MKITPHALTTSDQYLVVLVAVDFPGTQRIAKVRIPWEWLLEEDVVQRMDTAHRRRLIEIWSGVDLVDPLF